MCGPGKEEELDRGALCVKADERAWRSAKAPRATACISYAFYTDYLKDMRAFPASASTTRGDHLDTTTQRPQKWLPLTWGPYAARPSEHYYMKMLQGSENLDWKELWGVFLQRMLMSPKPSLADRDSLTYPVDFTGCLEIVRGFQNPLAALAWDASCHRRKFRM